MIMVNSLSLGIVDYRWIETETNQDSMPMTNFVVAKMEPFFTVIFTMELVIKVLAMGLLADKTCYLRDSWNVLDAIVVTGFDDFVG